MNKSILAILGLASACAICCSLPVAMGVASVLSMVGLSTFAWGGLTGQMVAAGLSAMALAGAGIWRFRRRAITCKANPDSDTCEVSAASGCGCAPAVNGLPVDAA